MQVLRSLMAAWVSTVSWFGWHKQLRSCETETHVVVNLGVGRYAGVVIASKKCKAPISNVVFTTINLFCCAQHNRPRLSLAEAIARAYCSVQGLRSASMHGWQC